ncbi:MAG: hypothetical protein B7Y37_13660 [Sphingobacteriia bacterium 28-36-52]|nr:MAG: hypothetical protein B7Y37_13660 [Sphingobacteriia bacterium 28-36-52]
MQELKWVISSEGFYCTAIDGYKLYAGSNNGLYFQWLIEKNGEILASSYDRKEESTTLQEAKVKCYQKYLEIKQKEKPQN